MPTKLLFPLDGSDLSFEALRRALKLYADAPIEVTLFNVVTEGFEDAPEDVVEQFQDDDEVFPNQQASSRMLERAAAVCRDAGVSAQSLIQTGRVAKKIVAESANHDVLVMHSLHRSAFIDAFRPSQGERIAREAGCSVLLVRVEQN